jgi:hypothetical protein
MKKHEMRCVDKEIIAKIIIYIAKREKTGNGEAEMRGVAKAQLDIKRCFALLPGKQNAEG